jgi:hypothetical protein
VQDSDVLAVDSVLVSPNPVERGCWFTFALSRSAAVRVRVFSLSGRVVADLAEQTCGHGFNTLYWDGYDQNGARPANGVYLFVLSARATDDRGQSQVINVRDKLILRR